MDLLDYIEDTAKTQFKAVQEKLRYEPNSRDEIDSDSDSEQKDFQDGTTNINGIAKSLGKDMGDISILEKVRRRLYGAGDDWAPTQAIEVVEKQNDDTQVVGSLDGIVFGNSMLSNRAQRLPQLEIDDDDFKTQENGSQQSDSMAIPTQQIKTLHEVGNQESQQIESLSQKSGNQEITLSEKPMTKEERQAKILQLAERKREERLAKEKLQEELEADISRTTLTDEENDLLEDEHDSFVSSAKQAEYSSKNLKEVEEFLNIQKREKIIQPEFKRKVLFTKDKLLSAFDDDDAHATSDKEHSLQMSSEAKMKSSPITSPLKSTVKINDNAFAESDNEEGFSVLDIIKNNPTSNIQGPPRSQKKNPIEMYAQTLKRELLSSPTKESNTNAPVKKLIDLDSGSDSEIDLYPRESSQNFKQVLKEIPQLSKEEKISIKQKFSKKKLANSSKFASSLPKAIRNIMGSNPKQSEGINFLSHLRKANVAQLQNYKQLNPEQEWLEEMEKEEELMGSLLEREFERARNIRKKEKMREKAAQALLQNTENGGTDQDEDYDRSIAAQHEIDSEVPDSDFEFEVNESDSEGDHQNHESESENNDSKSDTDNAFNIKSKRKTKRLILSDNDEEEIDKLDDENRETDKLGIDGKIERNRSDDSYMFGVEDIGGESLPHDELITTINTQSIKSIFGDNVSLTQNFENGTQFNKESSTQISDEEAVETSRISNDSYELFQNLKSRTIKNPSYSQIDENKSVIMDDYKELPSFRDISQRSQADGTVTQADVILTQEDASTQIIKSIGSNEDDNDSVTPLNLKEGRKLIRKNTLMPVIENENEDQDDEENPEIIKQRIKEYEKKIRKRELKLRKKRKELERKGIKNIVEGEAEESEDEWHGLGGVDDDLSDEQANSEDEKMIDNNFNLDLKNDEVRKKFMEQYQIKDQKDLEKLLDDIKNHRLSKRARANGFDIELSDEEDEMLMRYRRQKLREQQERLLANKKLQALSKDEKSKAFFASIQESAFTIKIDDVDDDPEEPDLNNNSDTKENQTDKDEQDDEDQFENDEQLKRTIKIEESFVQKQLSFLSKKNDEYEYDNLQRISRFQHGLNSSDEEIEDLQSLKLKSLASLNSKGSQSSNVIQSRKRSLEATTDIDEDDENDEEFMPIMKKPSIIKSFISFSENQGVQIKDGKQQFSGVTISHQYKVASGDKASITYLSRNKTSKKPVRSLKEKKIEKSLANVKQHNNRLFTSTRFDN